MVRWSGTSRRRYDATAMERRAGAGVGALLAHGFGRDPKVRMPRRVHAE